MDHERRSIRIRGVVQGVGFRPAMYRLADSLGLGGFVCNDREGVWVEVEGPSRTLDRFLRAVRTAAPPASRIDAIEVAALAPRRDLAFRIAESPVTAGHGASAEIPFDLAPCAACLRELEDSLDRRFRYPFINCTSCGPRYTIVRDTPYDRARTTMAAFAMCRDCRREYETPSDRRFHAEPNACPACGPRVQLVAEGRAILDGDAALHAAALAIADGQIVAVKGAGGFVLAVDARSEAAVARLRERKRRPHRAFAVMARTLAEAEWVAVLGDAERELLRSPRRPILLVPARRGHLARSVAPGLTDVGIYLPATPLQFLLLSDGPALQVMTSGNLADEPLARTNEEALERLADSADLFLLHDRDVHARADDSVLRSSRRGAIPMRRARGYVPDAIALPVAGPPVLGVGGHERNTVCLARAGHALVSQHVGDLDAPAAEAFLAEAIAHVQRLSGVDEPQLVAHDLHPDYRSTRWALASGLPRLAVQHHHAHVAACLVENGRIDRVVGIAFDGTGLGDDGTLWGGEVLEADLARSRRLGHLRALALPGGEAAIRE
ncbi:MAG: carbamoyltransferase HypF, partial [Deltaproteobacteria bacterium]|nr:carbamoyltransferase HypF [Deltaproteobacteria bacterium]